MSNSAFGLSLGNSFRNFNIRTYEALSSAAIAAARRNDAMLLFVNDAATNVFSNSDTAYVPASVGTSPSIGRWLDQQYGSGYLGSELVANGTFDNNIDGWTQTLGVVSWNSGKLRAARGAAQGGRATFALPPTVPGKTYRISVDRSIAGGVSSAGVVVTITAGSTVGALLSNYAGTTSMTNYTGVFIATQTQHWIALDTGTGTEGQYAEYDNISVKEIIEAPNSRGPELFVNGSFTSWTSDDPTGWTKTFTEDANTYITQVAGGARLVTTNGTFNEINQTIAVIGKSYELMVNVIEVSGNLVISNTSSSPITITSPGIYRAEFTAVGTSVGIKRGIGGAACDATIASISCKEVLGLHARQSTSLNKPTLVRIPRKKGQDKVINGGFDSGANWNLVNGAIISGGSLQLNSSLAFAEQAISNLEVGSVYELSYDVIASTGTSPLALSSTGFTGATQVLPSTVGVRNYFLATCSTSSGPLKLIAPNASTTITLDNVVLRKVTEYSNAVSIDGIDDFMDVAYRDYFASGAYTYIASWWGPITGNSSFVMAQSSTSSTNPVVSPLFVPSSSVNAALFERGDTGTTGLTGTTFATGALSKTNVVELLQVSSPISNFKGWLNSILDRNINYTRVSESITTNKVTFGAAQRTTTSGFVKGVIALQCWGPSNMPEADRKAIGRFAAFLVGETYNG